MSKTNESRNIGTEMERAAARWLIDQGYHFLEHSFVFRHGEIDLIYEKDGILCFGEVKYRRSTYRGTPAEAVDYRKRQRMVLGAQVYTHLKHMENFQVRFDVLEMLEIDGKKYIRLIANAFRPGE